MYKHDRGQESFRRGTNGISTNGVTAICMPFDRGTFWPLPLTYFTLIFPKVPGRTFSHQCVEIVDFCSGPISVDPVCPQPDSPHTRLSAPVGFETSH